MQWNFLPADGVNAPEAWANLLADHRPGGRGVIVAVLDTGVAYRNWHEFTRSPDFTGTSSSTRTTVVGQCNRDYPLDREGHGTFVAGVIAEATNNGIGLTGLAYGASIMPVRVLDAKGDGDASTIAAGHPLRRQPRRAGDQPEPRVLRSGSRAADIPDIVCGDRLRPQPRRRGRRARPATRASTQLAYPARTPDVISVGATTQRPLPGRLLQRRARARPRRARAAATTRARRRPELPPGPQPARRSTR